MEQHFLSPRMCSKSLGFATRDKAEPMQAIGTRLLRATTHLLDGLDNVDMTVRPASSIQQHRERERRLTS